MIERRAFLGTVSFALVARPVEVLPSASVVARMDPAAAGEGKRGPATAEA